MEPLLPDSVVTGAMNEPLRLDGAVNGNERPPHGDDASALSDSWRRCEGCLP